VHPRARDCILGGTLERGRWDNEPDPEETAAILRRCADIVPVLPTRSTASMVLA
jgi:D-amino-acid oxidase